MSDLERVAAGSSCSNLSGSVTVSLFIRTVSSRRRSSHQSGLSRPNKVSARVRIEAKASFESTSSMVLQETNRESREEGQRQKRSIRHGQRARTNLDCM